MNIFKMTIIFLQQYRNKSRHAVQIDRNDQRIESNLGYTNRNLRSIPLAERL